jgi:hypothetical protein
MKGIHHSRFTVTGITFNTGYVRETRIMELKPFDCI